MIVIELTRICLEGYCKMLGRTICLMLILIQGLQAQTLNNRITIELINKSDIKFAYLYDAKSTQLHSALLVNNTFTFNIIKKQDFQLMTLWLVSDTASNLERLRKISKDRSFNRLVAVEDFYMGIYTNAVDAIIKGGKFNHDLDRMNAASSSGDYALFFKELPDSPVAMVFLKALITLNKYQEYTDTIDVSAFYYMLSERQRNSEEGIALKKLI